MNEGSQSGPSAKVSGAIGAALLALAALVLLDSQRLPPGSALSVGPAAVMRMVAALLGVLGVVHFIVAWRGRHAARAGTSVAEPVSRAALAWVLAALGGLMLILQCGGGFIVAAAWLFVLAARGFGEPIRPRSLGIGVMLSTTVFVFFTKVLSLGLPAGPLERLLA